MTDWVINSPERLRYFMEAIPKQWDEAKYLKVTVREGKARTLDQNSLFHVWSRQYCAFVLQKHEKLISDAEHEAMKLTLKRHFYAAERNPWMLCTVTDYFTKETKRDYVSTTRLERGEMFMFMEWIQNKAAEQGLLLEAKGEFAELSKGFDPAPGGNTATLPAGGGVS